MRKDPLNLDGPVPSARPFDASKTLTLGAQQAICDAQELARALGSERVESAHLLLGLLQIEPPDDQLVALIEISGLKADEVRLYAQSALEQGQPLAPDAPLKLSESVRCTSRFAGKEARRGQSALVDVSHLFVACFRAQREPGLAEALAPLGVSADQLSLHLRQLVRGNTARALQNESPLAQLTAHSERALDVAHTTMRANFCGRISTLHLLIGVLENPDSEAVAALQTLMIDVSELKQRAAVAATGDGEIAGANRRFTPAAKRALDRAKAAAREGGRSHIGSADLLMGLLPQPLLLIERAQFGANPEDPAAALLRDVDADLVRAIFNPRQAATAPVKPVTVAAQSGLSSAVRSFAICFAIEFALCAAMGSMSRVPRRAGGGGAVGWMLASATGLLIISGVAACGVLIVSKDAGRKSAWASAFFGALTGILIGMTVSGVLK